MALGEFTPATNAAHPEYFWKAKGAKQGDFKNGNNSNHKDYKAYSRVFAVQWGFDQPMDQNSGQSAGKVQLKEFVITKYIDQSSPMLLQAMLNHEVITDSEFIYLDYPQAQGGKSIGAQASAQMTKIFVVTGTQGQIAKIEAGSTDDGRLFETIYMVFNEMTWKSPVGSTEADYKPTDDYKSSGASRGSVRLPGRPRGQGAGLRRGSCPCPTNAPSWNVSADP